MLPDSLRFIERDWLSANHIVGFDQDSHTAAVIDTGYHKHRQLSVKLIEATLGKRRLTRVINTHLHSDHCGGNALLQEKYGCQIIVPEPSWNDALTWDEVALTHSATAQTCERFTPTDCIRAGDTLLFGGIHWQVIAAPGHDPKSYIYFAPIEGILISADALWGNGFGVLFPELNEESGVDEQTQLLTLIEQLKPSIVIPGHGPMFTDVPQAIARARKRLEVFGHDRAKHAKNGIKVLMKFLLLDHEKVEIARLPELLRHADIMTQSSKLLGVPAMQAITRACDDLVTVGQLRRSEDGLFLYNS